jgi:hypothetical protein
MLVSSRAADESIVTIQRIENGTITFVKRDTEAGAKGKGKGKGEGWCWGDHASCGLGRSGNHGNAQVPIGENLALVGTSFDSYSIQRKKEKYKAYDRLKK